MDLVLGNKVKEGQRKKTFTEKEGIDLNPNEWIEYREAEDIQKDRDRDRGRDTRPGRGRRQAGRQTDSGMNKCWR